MIYVHNFLQEIESPSERVAREKRIAAARDPNSPDYVETRTRSERGLPKDGWIPPRDFVYPPGTTFPEDMAEIEEETRKKEKEKKANKNQETKNGQKANKKRKEPESEKSVSKDTGTEYTNSLHPSLNIDSGSITTPTN